MADFRRKITRTHKFVVIFPSIIVFKSVLSFAFQADKDCLYKEDRFLIFLPISLLPSFAFRCIYIIDPLDLVDNIFITGICYVLS